MALRITIDLFSGRPNPSVVVTGVEEREILDRLGGAATGRRSARRAAAVAEASPVLGYRGLIVEPLAEDGRQRGRDAGSRPRGGAAVPAPLRVARGVVQGDGRSVPVRDPGVEAFVCSPSGPFRAAGLDARFFDHLAAELHRPRRAARARAAAPSAAAGADRCACAPLWEPQWWNDGGAIQMHNNCYNYATDHRTDTYAQPGKANGAMFAAVTVADVGNAALADALLAAPAKNKCPRKGHLVAFFVYQWDFHWYRKQRDGFWTHKPGQSLVTQVDDSGALISDPRTADRGPYTDFGGFMIVMHGHVKII